ncbi:MAG: nuclear transport factor 2 family protein [Actinobacteria bacterium]|nr:nuclear transport factor 2 family protein [Actinomycetota bacterium]
MPGARVVVHSHSHAPDCTRTVPGVNDWEIAARLGVEDTIARYVRFADSGRSHELAALFTDDGALVVGSEERRGPSSITEFLEANKQSLAGSAGGGGRIRHHVSSLRIDIVSRDEAHATSYFLAITGIGPDHWGMYRDELRRVDDHWRFARREAITEGAAPGGWQGDRTTRSG